MRWVLICLAILASFAYFPQSHQRVIDGWSDFSIYLRGPADPNWLYPEYVAPLFAPLRLIPPGMAFGLYYGLGVLVWIYIIQHSRWIGAFSFYPVLLGIESGNVTPLLAFLCLFPLGSLLAMLVKPYLAVFVLVHAIGIRHRYNKLHGKQFSRSDTPKTEPHIHHGGSTDMEKVPEGWG